MPTSRDSCGGDEGARTLDLRLAKPALSQLSYVPVRGRVYNAPRTSTMLRVAPRLATHLSRNLSRRETASQHSHPML
jgi:hypothetical protein